MEATARSASEQGSVNIARDGVSIIHSDCLDWMRAQPDDSVDLIFGSPPYQAARTYGIDFKLTGQDWVDWMFERMVEMVRVCRGLVAMVVEGQTRAYRWSATPSLLMADLHRAGVCLRKPAIFHRQGIPGGSPDFMRGDWEHIICCTSGGRLPFADLHAMGHPCKYKTGGAFSYRTADGKRVNESKHLAGSAAIKYQSTKHRKGRPDITKPGDVISCSVGRGHMGDDLAHENEAPFPERLAEFFIRSFCPLGGIVLDPFAGSGTTIAVAAKWGRRGIAIDIRESQVELIKRRLAGVQPLLLRQELHTT